jgi:hypothetical protein
MQIPPGTNNAFNTQVHHVDTATLPYKTACWLSRSDYNGPYEPASTNPTNVWQCTYVTAYHDGPSLVNSTQISSNKFNGWTIAYHNSGIFNTYGMYNGSPFDRQWWLTEVEEQSNGTHIAHAVEADAAGTGILLQAHPWAFANPYNDTVRGYFNPNYTYTSTYLRPKHEVALHFGGQGTTPMVASPTPFITYYFQDTLRNVGHGAWSNATPPHLHEPSGVVNPNSTKLVPQIPLYKSSTESATGGTCNRTIVDENGWYQHSSKDPATDPWYWWDYGSYTWTKTYP